MMNLTDQKYKVGEIVTASDLPGIQLKVRRYVDRVYYCRRVDETDSHDFVYFERELRAY